MLLARNRDRMIADLDTLVAGWGLKVVRFKRGESKEELDLLSYAATPSLARGMTPSSCGVGGPGSARRNCAAMVTRRSLANMSRTDG